MKTIRDLWKKLAKVELVQVRPEEMQPLYNHCFEFNTPLIVEIGSAHGASSIILAEAARETKGELRCIDFFPEDYYKQEKFGDYARKAFRRNVLRHYSDVVDLYDMPSEHAIDTFSGDKIQILFIDGDHSYQGVRRDCENYLPLLQSGGYVAFHDYNNVEFSGVKKAADEFTQGWSTESYWDMIIRRKP